MSGPLDLGGESDRDDGEDLTAAEYALGVLDRNERAAAEARSDRDPAFAMEVFEWVVRLAPLYDEIPDVVPPESLWPRIEGAIAPLTMQTPDPAPPPRPANDLPGGLGFWRTWALAATAIAAAAILVIILRAPHVSSHHVGPSGGQATLVATLNLREGGASAVTIAYDPGQATLYASPDADFSIPRARAAELWLIPQDGKPRPMGLIDPSKPATMPMPPEYRDLAREEATLALSIEPAGGSKTGAPTGPVIATGKMTTV